MPGTIRDPDQIEDVDRLPSWSECEFGECPVSLQLAAQEQALVRLERLLADV